MFGLGWPEVIIIGIVGVLIFGPKKIPELGSALGKTLRGFKEEVKNPEADYEEENRNVLNLVQVNSVKVNIRNFCRGQAPVLALNKSGAAEPT